MIPSNGCAIKIIVVFQRKYEMPVVIQHVENVLLLIGGTPGFPVFIYELVFCPLLQGLQLFGAFPEVNNG